MTTAASLAQNAAIISAIQQWVAETPTADTAALDRRLLAAHPGLRSDRRRRLIAQALGAPAPLSGGAYPGAGRPAQRKIIRDGHLYLVVDDGRVRGEYRASIQIGTVVLTATANTGEHITIIEEG